LKIDKILNQSSRALCAPSEREITISKNQVTALGLKKFGLLKEGVCFK